MEAIDAQPSERTTMPTGSGDVNRGAATEVTSEVRAASHVWVGKPVPAVSRAAGSRPRSSSTFTATQVVSVTVTRTREINMLMRVAQSIKLYRIAILAMNVCETHKVTISPKSIDPIVSRDEHKS